jgi:hypothetical protein
VDSVIPSRSEDLKIDLVDSPKGARIMVLTGPLTLKTLFDFQQVSRQQSTHPAREPIADSASSAFLNAFALCSRSRTATACCRVSVRSKPRKRQS